MFDLKEFIRVDKDLFLNKIVLWLNVKFEFIHDKNKYIFLSLTLRRYTYFYWHRGYTLPKKSRHLFFHEKDLQKIYQYFEILFGDPILCSSRFCSNLFSDCLFITIYSDENISLENFVMSLLGHVYLRRVKIKIILLDIYFRLFECEVS